MSKFFQWLLTFFAVDETAMERYFKAQLIIIRS